MASSARIVIVSDTLTPNLKALPEKIEAAVATAVDYSATRAEAYAKTNAPWTDRTGNARGGLFTAPFHDFGNNHGYDVAHSVPYGIWLEVRFEGRYAIIEPTVQAMGPELMGMVASILRTF